MSPFIVYRKKKERLIYIYIYNICFSNLYLVLEFKSSCILKAKYI